MRRWPLMSDGMMIQRTVARNGVAAVLLCKAAGSKQGERSRERVSERSDGSGGYGKRTVVVIPSYLLPAEQLRVQPLPLLMEFDVLEMTGAVTALCRDTVGEESNVNSYKVPHLCTPAPPLQGEAEPRDGSRGDF